MSYAPPPPPGAELRLAKPWELCSPTASTKEGSMAADVRRWGGVPPTHCLQCGTKLGGVGGHAAHIGLLATGHHGHP